MTELERLESANKFKEALDLLQQKPTYDWIYFYNLGVLHGKLGQPGLATAYFEKANRLNPHDPEVFTSLKIAHRLFQEQLSANQIEVSTDGASNQFERFADRIQGDEIFGVMGLVLVIVSLLWIRAYLKTRNITKTFLKPSGWVGVFSLILMSAFYGIYKIGIMNPPAMVILKQPLRSGPGMTYPEITNIEPGMKVRMIGPTVSVNENDLWQKVRYNADQAAWLPLSSLLPL